jgi:hypothetical protein
MDPAESAAPPNNRAVRIIRFGSQTSVMAGNSSPAEEPVSVDPVAYDPPSVDDGEPVLDE